LSRDTASKTIVIRAIDNGNEVKVYEPKDRTRAHICIQTLSCFQLWHESLLDPTATAVSICTNATRVGSMRHR